jgi:transcriptional regulator with XRE-family HTH domain
MSSATTETPIGFGPYVKALRERTGVKQRQVAESIGMQQNQYSAIENNTKIGYLPAPQVVAGVARFFRVAEMELIRAAGYLTDSPAARRLDDDGDDWIAEQDRIAAALGPEQMQRFAERIVEVAQEEFLPKRPAVERQKGFGNL